MVGSGRAPARSTAPSTPARARASWSCLARSSFRSAIGLLEGLRPPEPAQRAHDRRLIEAAASQEGREPPHLPVARKVAIPGEAAGDQGDRGPLPGPSEIGARPEALPDRLVVHSRGDPLLTEFPADPRGRHRARGAAVRDPRSSERQVVEVSLPHQVGDHRADGTPSGPTLDQSLPELLDASRPHGQKTKGPFPGPEVRIAGFEARDEARPDRLPGLQSVPRHLLGIDPQPAAVVEHHEAPPRLGLRTRRSRGADVRDQRHPRRYRDDRAGVPLVTGAPERASRGRGPVSPPAWLARSVAAACGAGRAIPSFSRVRASISRANSGLLSRNSRALSRPWPRRMSL